MIKYIVWIIPFYLRISFPLNMSAVGGYEEICIMKGSNIIYVT